MWEIHKRYACLLIFGVHRVYKLSQRESLYPNPAEMPAAGGFGGRVQTYILFFSILRADKK